MCLAGLHPAQVHAGGGGWDFGSGRVCWFAVEARAAIDLTLFAASAQDFTLGSRRGSQRPAGDRPTLAALNCVSEVRLARLRVIAGENTSAWTWQLAPIGPVESAAATWS